MPPADAAPQARTSTASGIWWTRRAVALHVTIVVVVPVFVALFWWQVQRVRQGNALSWAYVFEWPFFTGYALYMWWKLVHDQAQERKIPATAGPDGPMPILPRAAPDAACDDAADEKLAAYNRYLAELHASGRKKQW